MLDVEWIWLLFFKFSKREKKKIKFNSRIPRDFLYANEDHEFEERVQSEIDDELGLAAIKANKSFLS